MQSSVLSSSDVDIIAITLVVIVLVACLVACGSYWQKLLLQETRSLKILSKRLPPSPTITHRPMCFQKLQVLSYPISGRVQESS